MENKPIRVQRRRCKGFKLPENTVCVTRRTKYGNPFRVNRKVPEEWVDKLNDADNYHYNIWSCGFVETNEDSVYLFENYVLPTLDVTELKGKNLACFCDLSKKCHVEPLLKKANQ